MWLDEAASAIHVKRWALSQKQSVMSLQFESRVLDLWFEGSHHADPHEHGAEAKSKGVTNPDQVMAVVQALQRQQSEATGTSPSRAEPVNDVARAFLLSGPKQSALIPPSPTPYAGIPPSTTQSARIPPSATQNARSQPNYTQNTAIGGEGRYSTENADRRVEVSIRRHSNSSECDVIVAIRDREMVVRLPDYGRAVKWAQMESRSYRLPVGFAETGETLRSENAEREVMPVARDGKR